MYPCDTSLRLLMSGFHFLYVVRRHFPDIPVIAVVALTTPVIRFPVE
jgi:hypothetical protein